jgi:hypothetical protein
MRGKSMPYLAPSLGETVAILAFMQVYLSSNNESAK